MKSFITGIIICLFISGSLIGQNIDFNGYCSSGSTDPSNTFSVNLWSVYNGFNITDGNVPSSISALHTVAQPNYQNNFNTMYVFRPGERIYFSLNINGDDLFYDAFDEFSPNLPTFDTLQLVVFADWNGDGTLENSEEAYPLSYPGNLEYFGVEVPENVIQNEPIIIRFILQRTNSPDDVNACGTYDNGQTQNFVVKFVEQNSESLEVENAVAAAVDENDTIMAVWIDDSNDLYGTFIRNNSGTTIISDFLIDNNAYEPAVVYNPQDDNFLVVWNKGYNSIESAFFEKGSSTKDQNQIFNAVASSSFTNVSQPTACYIKGSSEFLIAWVSDAQVPPSSDFTSEIWSQKLQSNGSLVFGSPENLTAPEGTTDLPSRQNPKVAYSSNDNKFILTWENYIPSYKKITISSKVFLNNSELEFSDSQGEGNEFSDLTLNTQSHNLYSTFVSFDSPDVLYNSHTNSFFNIWNYQALNYESNNLDLLFYDSDFYGKQVEINGSNNISQIGSLINFSDEYLINSDYVPGNFETPILEQRLLSNMSFIEDRNEFLIANLIGPIPISYYDFGSDQTYADSLVLYRINGLADQTDNALIEKQTVLTPIDLTITNSSEDGFQFAKPALVYSENQRRGRVFFKGKNNGNYYLGHANFVIGLDPPPTISSTSKDTVQAGNSFVINGSNFSETAALNIVKLGTTELTVNSSTTGSLNVMVPSNLTRGSYTLSVEFDGQIGTFGQSIFIKAVPAFNDFTPKTVFDTESVTITGSGFSTNLADNEILLTNVNDNLITYIGEITASTNSTVTFDLPSGIPRGNYYIKASVDGLGVQHAQSLKVKVLHDITSITPTSGLANDIITLTGTNFSTNLNTFPVTATIGGLSANVISSTSENINLRIPQNLSRGVTDILVTIDGETVSEIGALTILVPPDPASLDPDSAYANQIISILGQNFRSSLSGNTVQVGNIIVTQSNIISASANKIDFRIPNGLARGFQVVSVTTDGQKVNVPSQLKYKVKPTISGLSAAREEPFNTITINGSNFSTDENFVNKVLFGDKVATIQDTTSTALTVVIPDLISRDAVEVKVIVDGDTAVSTQTFSAILGSVISGINPDTVYSGDQVVISGSDFLETPDGNEVYVKDLKIPSLDNVTNSEITFTMPAGLQRGIYDVMVITDGISGISPEQLKYKISPVIDELSSYNQEPFTSLTISGSNFSTVPDFVNTVYFGDIEADIDSKTNTTLTVTIPALPSRDPVPVTVIVDGDTATAPELFSAILGSGIYSIVPDSAYTGDEVTIFGSDFKLGMGENQVKVGAIDITNITNVSATEISFLVPASLSRGYHDVQVTTDGKVSISPVQLKKKIKPSIAGLSKTRAFSGDTISISGSNFSIDDNFPNTVLFGNVEASIDQKTTTQLTISVPNGLTRQAEFIHVIVDGDTATSTQTFRTLIQPELVSFTPNRGEPGDTIIIFGNNFLPDNVTDNIVRIGGLLAPVINAQETQLEVKIPENSKRGNAAITIVVDELTDSLSIEENPLIIQIRPLVTGLTDNIGHTSEVIEITGEKFSVNANFPNEVYLGDLKLNLDQSLANQNSIKFTVPNDLHGLFPVKVIIDGMEAESSPMLMVHLGGEPKNTIPVIPPSTFNVNEGSLTIGIEVFDQNFVINPVLFGKGFSDEAFSQLSKSFSISQNQLTLTLSQNDIQDELGYSYYLQWQHDNDQLPDSTFTTDIVHLVLNYTGEHSDTEISGINFVTGKGEGSGNDYQILSIPYVFQNKDPRTVLSHPKANGYDNRYFRLFSWNKSTQQYAEYGNNNFGFELGDAYFLIAREGTTFDINNASTWNLEENGLFELVLKNGWNLIGTPYPFDIDWSAVLAENGSPVSLEDLIVFENGSFINSNKLEKFRGGFIRNTGSDLSLLIPVTAKSNGRKAITKNSEENWRMNLDLSSSKISNKTSRFGVDTDSDEGLDENDQHRVPRFLEYVDIEFTHPSFNDEQISTSIIGPHQYYTWEFMVNSSDAGGIHFLGWDNFDFLNRDLQIVLFDVEHQKVINMRDKNSYSFSLVNQHRFKIFFGDQQYIDENLIPEKSVLSEPYPNPFSDHTMIPLTLDKKYEYSDVTLLIFDINGKEVYKTIYPQLMPGFHQLQWRGNNNFGTKVDGGAYILQVIIQNDLFYQIDSKMVIKN